MEHTPNIIIENRILDAYFESGGSGARSIQPKFPEISVQNSIFSVRSDLKSFEKRALLKKKVHGLRFVTGGFLSVFRVSRFVAFELQSSVACF